MIVKELFGTQIINASFLFANSNISVKYYSKDFPTVVVNNRTNKIRLILICYLLSCKFNIILKINKDFYKKI
jgi:hypothetical protein